jgi:hypothetical protein
MEDEAAQCPKVKCATCGYLAGKRDQEPELLMASPRWRKHGNPDGPNGMEFAPHCFRGVTEPNEEYHALKEEIAEKRLIFLRVVNTERVCAEYRKFDPGYTPKEHAEMHREERLRREQQEQRERDLAFQEERRKQDKADAEAQRERDEARRAQDKADTAQIRKDEREWKEQQDRVQWRRTVITGIGVAILAAILSVLAEPWKSKQAEVPAAAPPVAKP